MPMQPEIKGCAATESPYRNSIVDARKRERVKHDRAASFAFRLNDFRNRRRES